MVEQSNVSAVNSGVTVEREIPLPNLTVTETLRSPEPIFKLSNNGQFSPEMGVIQAVGKYTLAVAKGASQLAIYDHSGRKIQDLENTNTTVIEWANHVRKPDGIGSYWNFALEWTNIRSLSDDAQRNTKLVKEFPLNLQPFIRGYIQSVSGNKGIIKPPDAQDVWRLSTGNIKSLQLAQGEDYVFLYDFANKMYLAFQTKDERGNALPPRNWKRFDITDGYAGTLPPTIAAEIDTYITNDSMYSLDVDSEYHVSVQKDRLVVTKTGKKISESDFVDRISGVNNNVCQDPSNRGVVYYCASDDPRAIHRLDTTTDPSGWRTEANDLTDSYQQVANLSIDPTGNFITFQSGNKFVILRKDSLSKVGEIPGIYQARLDMQGRIRGVDPKGHLVVYDANFQEISVEINKQKAMRLAQGLTRDLFRSEASNEEPEYNASQFEALIPVKAGLRTAFDSQISAVSVLQDMMRIKAALEKTQARLQSEGMQKSQIDFLTQDVQTAIREKERSLALPELDQLAARIQTKLSGSLTLASLAELKVDFAKLSSLQNLADDATRVHIQALESQYDQQSAELFRREGAVIVKDANDMVRGARTELENITSMSEFSDWQEFRLPQLVSTLQTLARDMPIEAADTQAKVLEARRELIKVAKEYEAKFKEGYAAIREKAAQLIGEQVELVKLDIDSFIQRLQAKGFTDRTQAELYMSSSPAFAAIGAEIDALKRQNPEIAKQLAKDLKVRIATTLYEIERGASTTIADTGQQMVVFGNTQFPRWEAAVKEKVARRVDLTFIPDERTKGPGVSAENILGEVGVLLTNSSGKSEKKRVYEGLADEDDWRYGSVLYRGEYVPPAYLSQSDYRELKRDYQDWSKGSDSRIRQELHEKKRAVRDHYKQRQLISERDEQKDAAWADEHEKLIREYANFVSSKHVLILSRIDQLRDAPEVEFANGSGYVPEWQSHWTVDETTEHYLEEMAKDSGMQLELQEGLLVLKGHAGTGKDVLVKMFCNRTNRPYFSVDCSKWTTEFELSEDVVLEAEDGASKTVKVPSVVLNAITTPGAVMYFNEINAMPEQAQIFLHGLMDEKRTLTLKTSSGRAVRTLNSVLLMGSMNPGYPGTFDPQFATKSRMVGLEIDYPALYREKSPTDTNPNPPISAAEALRVARQVDSLADYTYEPDLKHNDFVQIWDKYVNGIQNGAPELTQAQQFDIEVILTMVEFADKLRQGFILKFEKAKSSSIPKGTLLVSQPITGREMRRMAYWLSKMTPEEKLTANPESVTRELFEAFFLSHIDKKDERSEIRTAMATWTSFKRLAA